MATFHPATVADLDHFYERMKARLDEQAAVRRDFQDVITRQMHEQTRQAYGWRMAQEDDRQAMAKQLKDMDSRSRAMDHKLNLMFDMLTERFGSQGDHSHRRDSGRPPPPSQHHRPVVESSRSMPERPPVASSSSHPSSSDKAQMHLRPGELPKISSLDGWQPASLPFNTPAHFARPNGHPHGPSHSHGPPSLPAMATQAPAIHVERPFERSNERAVDRATERHIDRPIERPVERPHLPEPGRSHPPPPPPPPPPQMLKFPSEPESSYTPGNDSDTASQSLEMTRQSPSPGHSPETAAPSSSVPPAPSRSASDQDRPEGSFKTTRWITENGQTGGALRKTSTQSPRVSVHPSPRVRASEVDKSWKVPAVPHAPSAFVAIQHWETADPSIGLNIALKDWPADWRKLNQPWMVRRVIYVGYERCGKNWDVFEQRHGNGLTRAANSVRKELAEAGLTVNGPKRTSMGPLGRPRLSDRRRSDHSVKDEPMDQEEEDEDEDDNADDDEGDNAEYEEEDMEMAED